MYVLFYDRMTGRRKKDGPTEYMLVLNPSY